MATWLDQSSSGSNTTYSTYESNSLYTNLTSFGDSIHREPSLAATRTLRTNRHVSPSCQQQEQTSRTLTTAETMASLIKDMKAASPDVLRLTARDVFYEKIRAVKNGKDTADAAAPPADAADTASSTPNSTIKESTDEPTTDATIAVDFTPEDRIPKYDERDLILGRVLGRGAFCVVRECNLRGIDGNGSVGSDGSNSFVGRMLRSSHRSSSSRSIRRSAQASSGTIGGSISNTGGGNAISSSRSAGGGSIISENGRRVRKGRYRYVIKQLSPELSQNDKISYLKGVVDLAMETHLLSSIEHENIVGLHGMASRGPFEEGYFIVLEKICETLSKKVKGWMDIDRQCKGITGVFTGSKKKLEKLQSERLVAAYQLASGMNYLHQRKIVFRDLKPDNIGFDYVGKWIDCNE
jgi:Protein kinase domain